MVVSKPLPHGEQRAVRTKQGTRQRGAARTLGLPQLSSRRHDFRHRSVTTHITNALQEVELRESTVAPPDPSPDGFDGWKALVSLSAVAGLICAVDRAAISVAILPMSQQFGWDDSTKGSISSIFLVGYTLSNLAGGYLATLYRPKRVLAVGVVVWSAFTIATPYAAHTGSLPVLLACRMLMGMGEGVTFPCIQELVSRNVPSTTKSTALTLIYSGAQAGTIVSFLLAPTIISTFSWPAVFYIFGASGFVWLLGWLPLAKDILYQDNGATSSSSGTPSTLDANATDASSSRTSTSIQTSNGKPTFDESRPAAANGASANGATSNGSNGATPANQPSSIADFPWRTLLTNRAFWAIFIAHSAFGFGHHMAGAWLPSYYFDEFGLDVRSSAWLSALPYLAAIIVMSSAGWSADKLVSSNILSRIRVRKLLQFIGGVGPGACMLYLAAAANHDVENFTVASAVGTMTLMVGLGGFTGAGFGTNHQDLTQKYPGILFGITNTACSLAGVLSVYATGVLLDATDSWALVFEAIAMLYIGSSIVYVAWASADNQLDGVKVK